MHLHFFCEFRTPYLIIYIAPSIHLESKRQVSEDVDENNQMREKTIDETNAPGFFLWIPNSIRESHGAEPRRNIFISPKAFSELKASEPPAKAFKLLL